MASISEQRLKEMEAEMNRFEQEIAPSPNDEPQAAQGLIISSGTFDQVQAQLRQLRQESSGMKTDQSSLAPPPPPPPETVSQSYDQKTAGIDLAALAPPPPPPPEPAQDQNQYPSDAPPMRPPPPPPPSIMAPAFVPPQLRHRPPMNHHMPHMGHPRPHGMPGPGHMMPVPFPPQHHMLRHQHMGQHMGFHQGPFSQPGFPMMGGGVGSNMGGNDYSMDGQQTRGLGVIEAKSKIIYSAPPVKKVSKGSDSSAPTSKKGAKSEGREKPSDAGVYGPAAFPDGLAASNSYDEGMSTAGTQSVEDTTLADMEIDADVSMPTKRERKEKKRKFVRMAAGTVWEDPTLAEWEQDDFRMFCGDLGNEVTDEVLTRAFGKYPSFTKAKVIRDRRTNKTKGFGFVSFKDPVDFARAMREMNGKYVGNRPIKLRKSTWKDRNIDLVRKKEKEKKRLGLR